MRDRKAGLAALLGRDGPAQRLQALAQGRSVVDRRIQSVTRKCRYEPLLSNQSNKVGRAEGGKASPPRSRTCKILPTSHYPWVFKLRSRGNPARNRTPQATPEDFTTMRVWA